MATTTFLRLDGIAGESSQRGHERWIELQGWDWEVEAAAAPGRSTGPSRGSGAARPRAGALTWTQDFEEASIAELGRIASGTRIASAVLHVTKTTGQAVPETYLTATMQGVRVTRVATTGAEDGVVLQQISIVFDQIVIDYRRQDTKTGVLGAPTTFGWDIPAGTASPSA